jgi:hypothetical protein
MWARTSDCNTGGIRVVSAIVASLLIVVGLGPNSTAGATSAPTWSRLAPATAPSPRAGVAMVRDELDDSVVLFGGEDASFNFLNDTWTWNGATWVQQYPDTSPPPRAFANVAFDRDSGKVLLFGGRASNVATGLDDTWLWDGVTWTRLTPPLSPPPLWSAGVAYDGATHEVILTGGCCPASDETWAWDGSTWLHQIADGPPARLSPAMDYDAATQSIVLFGGHARHNLFYGDTWVWAGDDTQTSTWAQQTPTTSPPPRSNARAAFDISTQDVVLFGGFDPSFTERNDTWSWNGQTWARQTPATAPPGRDYFGMAYDPNDKGVLLFGGFGNGAAFLGDTWIFKSG